MKNALILLLSASIFLTACGNENTEVGETSTNETVEAAEESITDEQKRLMVGELNEQFGGESKEIAYADELASYTKISEKDGYTYILDGMWGELKISIVKDNKFLVKDKLLVESDGIIDSGMFGNYCLYTTFEADGLACNVIAINENGATQHSIVKRGLPIYGLDDENGIPNTNGTIINGLSGAYFRVEEDSTFTIIKHNGEELYTYSSIRGGDSPLLDEYNGRLYFNAEDGYVSAFDLEKDEMIWAEDGSEMRFYLPERNNYVGNDEGFYVVDPYSGTEDYIYFYSTKNNDLQLVDQTTLVSALDSNVSDSKYRLNMKVFATLDDKNLNVFRYVTYKGEPTFQKTSYPRIDLDE